MADVTQEFRYELMERFHERFDKLENSAGDVRREMNAMHGQMVAMGEDLHNTYGMLSRHDDRLDRIERRLELREMAEPASPSYDPGSA